MDDSKYGTRNKRGDWTPYAKISPVPIFVWPVRPLSFLRWLLGIPGYIFPWNALYLLISLVVWLYLTPNATTTKVLEPGWISYLLARNAILIGVVAGVWHFHLYSLRKQGSSFKFNGRWPASGNSAFLFKRQIADNLFWTFVSAVPIWTAFEVFMLWAFSNHYIPYVDWRAHPYYCAALMLAIPFIHDFHFYVVHRALHWPPLYRFVHKLHHNNVNPIPFSGLAMHPVEHFFYFTGVLVHVFIPSHPLHALFHILHSALSPAQGHAGFSKVLLGQKGGLDTESYGHYLHHKYFECNYADGMIPLDRWFGTFHDGSHEAQVAMDKRLLSRAARENARRATPST